MSVRSSIHVPSIAECREELRAVLASRGFRQAEHLARLLEYLGDKALSGESGNVTEYTIAVDVFGKPRFRETRDSSVRVDVHRLRKRLAAFYAHEGADHRLRIGIPSGSYAPDFQVYEAPPETTPSVEAAIGELNVVDPRPNGAPAPVPAGLKTDVEPSREQAARKPTVLRLALPILAGVLLVIAGFWLAQGITRPDGGSSVITAKAMPPAVIDNEAHILAGFTGGAWTDATGHVWQSDRYFKGGVARPGPVGLRSAPLDRRLYSNMREAVSDDKTGDPQVFSYDVPLRPGTYELRLYFADPLMDSPPEQEAEDNQDKRRFVVMANGQPLLGQFDAVADAGYADVDVRAFKDITPASDGKVHLAFIPQPHRPFVNAIELVPSRPGHANPVRMTARRSTYTDPSGKTWGPDNYFTKGRLIRHAVPAGTSNLPELFRSERYGNFGYSIPVAPGSYTLTLYFAETLFSPMVPSPFCRGPACRVFDVSCNGVTLLKDLDVFQAGGGAYRPVVRSFPGLRPNGQGKLVVSFSSSINYAEVRALEVVDETP